MCWEGHDYWDILEKQGVHVSLVGPSSFPFSAGNIHLEVSLAKAMAICLKGCVPFSCCFCPHSSHSSFHIYLQTLP